MGNGKQLKQVKTVTGEDLSVYYNDLRQYKPLTHEEEKSLLIEYQKNNDLVARQKLITANLRYAFSLVNKYKNRGVPLSDLLEEANIGLIESIDKFDADKDVKIITYAKWNMLYRINEAIKEHNKIETSDLPEEHEEQVGNIAELSGEYDRDSYDNAAFYDDENETNEEKIGDINSIISVLDERETDFVKMYYGIQPYETESTYQEIGDKYNITKERVRQIMDKIMRKMRAQALTILKQ